MYKVAISKARILSLLLTLILVCSLSSCSEKTNTNVAKEDSVSDTPLIGGTNEQTVDFTYKVLYNKQVITEKMLYIDLGSGGQQYIYKPEKIGDFKDEKIKIDSVENFNELLFDKLDFYDNRPESTDLYNTTANIIITDYKRLSEVKEYFNNKKVSRKELVSKLSEYDEKYFKDKALILHFISKPYGGNRHSIKKLSKEGYKLKITAEVITPEVLTEAGCTCNIILEVNKTDVEGVENVEVKYFGASKI